MHVGEGGTDTPLAYLGDPVSVDVLKQEVNRTARILDRYVIELFISFCAKHQHRSTNLLAKETEPCATFVSSSSVRPPFVIFL